VKLVWRPFTRTHLGLSAVQQEIVFGLFSGTMYHVSLFFVVITPEALPSG
jgi:hypothetical protein